MVLCKIFLDQLSIKKHLNQSRLRVLLKNYLKKRVICVPCCDLCIALFLTNLLHLTLAYITFHKYTYLFVRFLFFKITCA